MRDEALIELITRKVLEQLQTEYPCSGCALRTCAVGNRACDAVLLQNKIPVGVSARHAHVTQEHLEILYGAGHQLVAHAPLYQPGAFAAIETLTIVGRRIRAIEGIRILDFTWLNAGAKGWIRRFVIRVISQIPNRLP